MSIHLNVCKQMIDIKLLLLWSNTWSHLTVCKQISLGLCKKLSRKYVYKSFIFNIYV